MVEGGVLRAVWIRLSRNQGSGLVLRGGSIWIRSSSFAGNGANGLELLGGEATLEGNLIVDNGGHDILISGAAVEGEGNVVSERGMRGVPEGFVCPFAVSTNLIDFGETKGGSRSFTIANRSGGTLRGSISCSGDCDVFAVSPDSFNIGPGGSRTIDVSFSPTARRLYSATLRIETDRGQFAIDLVGFGTLTPYFDVADIHVYPEKPAVRQEVTIKAEIENTGDVEGTQEIKLYIDGRPVDSKSLILGPGKESMVFFTYTFEVEETHNVEVRSEVTSKSIEIEVGPPPTLEVSPNYIDFGEVEVGSPAIESFWIHNEGWGILEGTISCSGDCDAFEFSPTSFKVGAGEFVKVEVTFRPCAEEHYGATLEIRSNGGEVNIELEGYGYR